MIGTLPDLMCLYQSTFSEQHLPLLDKEGSSGDAPCSPSIFHCHGMYDLNIWGDIARAVWIIIVVVIEDEAAGGLPWIWFKCVLVTNASPLQVDLKLDPMGRWSYMNKHWLMTLTGQDYATLSSVHNEHNIF